MYHSNPPSSYYGTDSIIADQKNVGDPYTIRTNSFNIGLTFVTWNTKPDGSGTTYPPGQAITVSGSLILYAQWTGPVTITYHSNPPTSGYGKDVSFSESATVGQSYTISSHNFNIGLTFLYWNTKPDGTGTTYPPGKVITVTGPLVLYAQWAGKVISPILIDLDGTGIQTTSLANGVMFDYAGTGNPVKTAWATPNCGFLVRDLNGNGQIDNGGEMFGNFTVLKSGVLATNGFDALAELDTNGDGIITQAEATAAGIMIWQDKNTNGKVDPGELLTLAQAGVQSFGTQYTTSHNTDANGNIWRWQGTVNYTTGKRSVCVDVLFVTQ